jgi:7-cyano-7-deazaguanine synthase in queuosine biosynthesis
MQRKHIIPCGGLAVSVIPGKETRVLPLTLWAGKGRDNVTLKVEDLHRSLYKPVPPQFEDLLEIAAYVCCADQATSRGGKDVEGFGGHWRRDFEFHIPVRAFEFWNRPETGKLLKETLEFLSDDYFDFKFVEATNAPPMQQYFDDFDAGWELNDIERVVLFSGGLDSLAGAVKESVEEKRRVMYVTHRPTTKLNNVQRNLEELLAKKAGKYRPMHVHVRAWKDSDLNKSYTQRTRSFLFAAIGATVAKMLGLDCVRFYENGVVSMNLPVCAQVVGSRATRTTHPRTLTCLRKLLTAVASGTFGVENDFIWDTKADVVRRILKAGCGDLIGASISCAHVHEFELAYPHCGVCSQCIDRRLGVVAAAADDYDPAGRYKSDVFTGERPKREDRMMVASYVERANKLAKLRDAADLIANYPEVVRVFGHLPGKPDQVADLVLGLQRRHAVEVNGAIETMLARKAKELRERTLSPDCLLRLTYDSRGTVAPATPPVKECLERQEKRWEEEKEGPNTYRLSKGLNAWRLVFQGNVMVMKAERGLTLVDYLLKHPTDEAIHAVELEALVDGNPLIGGLGCIERAAGSGDGDGEIGGVIVEAAGNKVTGGTGTLLKTRLAELEAQTQDMTLIESEREAAQKERDELLTANASGGRMLDAAGRAAERVRKAIRRFIDELNSEEVRRGEPNVVLRSFGEHLERNLWLPSVGLRGRAGASGRPGCFIYERPKGVVWRD